ncbi:MAG: ATP-binding protein [Pseudomonadota bacterium]
MTFFKKAPSNIDLMIESVVDGVIMIDNDHDVVVINSRAKKMLGFKKSETVTGEKIYKRIDIRGWKISFSDDGAAGCISKEFVVLDSEHAVFRFDASPVKDAHGALVGIVVVLRDVTREREVDRMKREFISTVSHELRTPLSITKEGIGLIMDGIIGPVSDKQKNILYKAHDNIDRLSRIINNLLDISKIESGKSMLTKRVFEVTALLSQVHEFFRQAVQNKGLEFRLQPPSEQMMIYADMDKVVQVFSNLIGNALKFTEKGNIEISAVYKSHGIEFCVKDTGGGISPKDLSKVFEKFQQFDRTEGGGERGTGLGLSITKGIVEMHKGRIWVESDIGKGSCFKFLLPMHNEDILKSELHDIMSNDIKSGSCSSVLSVLLENFDQLKKNIDIRELLFLLNDIETVLQRNIDIKKRVMFTGSGSFIVFLQGCEKKIVKEIVNNLKVAYEKHLMDSKILDRVGVLINSATFPHDANNPDEMLRTLGL